MKNILIVYIILLSGCSFFHSVTHDPQLIQINLKGPTGDEVNTFSGMVVKDLVILGKDSTSFWFTKQEQDRILAKVDSIDFYSLPDTIKPHPNIIHVGFDKPSFLRIRIGDKDKTVVSYHPVEERNEKYNRRYHELFWFIWKIVQSKEEYKSLPESEGTRI
jgi:hypothetical protein